MVSEKSKCLFAEDLNELTLLHQVMIRSHIIQMISVLKLVSLTVILSIMTKK